MGLLRRLFASEASRCADVRQQLIAFRLGSDRNVHALGAPRLAAGDQPEDALLDALRLCRDALDSERSHEGAVRRVRGRLQPVPPLPWPISLDRLLWLWLALRFPDGPHLSARFFDLTLRPFCQELQLELGTAESVMGMNLEHQVQASEELVDPFDHLPALHRHLTQAGYQAELTEQLYWAFWKDGDVIDVQSYPERALISTHFNLARDVVQNPALIEPVATRLNRELLTKLRFYVDGPRAYLEFVVPRRLAATDPADVIRTWNEERLGLREVGQQLRLLML